jgi:hypothetical protein
MVSVQPNKVITNRTVFLDNIQPCNKNKLNINE